MKYTDVYTIITYLSIAQWLADLLLGQSSTGLIPSMPKSFSVEKIVDIAEVNQQRCFAESGQWLENVD